MAGQRFGNGLGVKVKGLGVAGQRLLVWQAKVWAWQVKGRVWQVKGLSTLLGMAGRPATPRRVPYATRGGSHLPRLAG